MSWLTKVCLLDQMQDQVNACRPGALQGPGNLGVTAQWDTLDGSCSLCNIRACFVGAFCCSQWSSLQNQTLIQSAAA